MGIFSYTGKTYRGYRQLSKNGLFDLRDIIKTFLPNRWKKEPIWENLCHYYGRNRLFLPKISVETLFPGFNEIPVKFSLSPLGDWSANLNDQMALAKLASLLSPQAVLEVGSFRGYTARLLAENTPSETTIHTVDINPEHGEAYLNTPLERKIKRHIGSLDSCSLKDLKFDFIFLDADHKKEAVKADTKILLSLLAEQGVLLWHDYADWGWISGYNGVPEALSELSPKIPIVAIPGTALAIHRQGWTYEHYQPAITAFLSANNQSRWITNA